NASDVEGTSSRARTAPSDSRSKAKLDRPGVQGAPRRAIGRSQQQGRGGMASDRVFSLFLRRGKTRANDLGRMTLGELVVSYATYPSVLLYAALAVAAAAGAVKL